MVGCTLMSHKASSVPRIGIPYRTRKEEVTGDADLYGNYLSAARSAGSEPVPVSLRLSTSELHAALGRLDAFILPGSPADVHPSLFKAAAHPDCSLSDPRREATDFALLEHALAEHKAVLAICYGLQTLNVFLGGTLLQDISTEIQTEIQHSWPDHKGDEPHHSVIFEPESRLRNMAVAREAVVNSSHHQSVLGPGRHLRIVARAKDGITEAVEWTGNAAWVMGVQWHPERMAGTDPLAQALFRSLVAAARKEPAQA
jgi:putative glutamine amidotransferase